MDRRSFLLGAVLVGAGCTGGAGTGREQTDERTETPTATRTPTPETSLVSRSFKRTGECNTPGNADITASEKLVTITGCIQGRNGCMQAALDSAEMSNGSASLTVVITTKKEGGDVCSQQIVQRGYEATFGFEGSLPGEVRVIHESMGDRREVASVNVESG